MEILNYQEAFGETDKTSQAMRDAIDEWFSLYYRSTVTDGEDPCQRIAYTVINKLVRTTFAEYRATTDSPFTAGLLRELDRCRAQAMQLALAGGSVFIKPWPEQTGFGFSLIPRDQILIFARDPRGNPTDVGVAEHSVAGKFFYTLLERRRVDEKGFLTIENKLYRATQRQALGQQVSLKTHPLYALLPERYTYRTPVGSVGLAELRTDVLNCVDGSADAVGILAAVTGLIHSIDRNEFLLSREFENGRSRIFASADLLREGQLDSELFVGLDEDPAQVGVTVFSPALRQESFLARKQEYLRNVESVIGLKRGLLSDANVEERTATEIASSQGEHALTALDFQRMWERLVAEVCRLCGVLGRLYAIAGAEEGAVAFDWGNGVLFDEAQLWADYKDMVRQGLLLPEVALGWRFGLPADTPQQRAAIREKLMPNQS